MRSVAGGLIWGGLAAVVGLTVASLVAPVRDPEQFAATPPAVVSDPQPATQTPAMEQAAQPDAAPQAPVDEAPATNAPAPTTGSVDVPPGSEFNRAPADGVALVPGADDPALPDRQAPAPDVSDVGTAPSPDTSSVPAPQTDVTAPDAMTPPQTVQVDPALPQTGEQPVLPSPESASPQPPAAEAQPIAPVAPQTEPSQPPAGSAGSVAIGLPQPGFDFQPSGVRTGRLPAIGQDPTPEPEVAPEPVTLGALARNSVPFKRSGDKPLMAIVIVDEGDAGLDRATLSTFSFPVTFAIDAARPDAVEAMQAYRKAGFETVLMTGGLPTGATPQDLETTLASYIAQMDQTIAVMDVEGGLLGSSRALQTQLIEIAQDSGHGVVSFDRGLKTIDQLAQAAKVPSALIYRSMDDQGESAPVIQRVLKRAAFKAGQDGQVVMLGHSRADTVTALFEWALEGSTEVDLAPLSEVLKFRR